MSRKIKYNIDVSLNENQIHIEVSGLKNPWFIRGYYLYKDGNMCKRAVKDNLSPSYDFTLEEDGLYFVKVYIKNGDEMQTTNSVTVAYFKDATKKEFDNLLKQKHDKKYSKKIDIFELKEPFQNFAIVVSNKEIDVKSIKKEMPKKFNFHHTVENNIQNLIISSEEIIENKDRRLIFSGFCKYNNDILIGNKQASIIDNSQDLIETVGNFTFAYLEKEKFIIGKDYFGTTSIFYYNTPDCTIVSNEYHMLITIMKALGLKMELDEKVAIANLSFYKSQVFEQHLTKRMEVKGVYQLPIEKYIEISNGKFELKDTSMVELLKKDFDVKDYEKLLKQAADEIMENIKLVYNSDKFKNVIVDVTGGTDSRIVFAGVTNIDDKNNKTQIHTADDKRTKDITIAIPLNNLYGYKYDTIPETLEYKDFEDGYKVLRSLNLGAYYYIDYYRGRREADQTIRLMGGGGEAIARPYYTKYLLHDEIADIQNSKDFVREFFSRRPEDMLLGDKNGIENCVNVFSDEIEKTIGEGVLQKFENTYMILRSGTHLNHRGNQTQGFIEWFPVYSKTAFFLKMKTYYIFKSTKLAFDLIQYLNPILANIPYEKKENNMEYERIKDTLLKQEPRYGNLKLTLNKDATNWEQANIEKEKVTKLKKPKKVNCTREERYNDLLDAFIYLISNSSEQFKEVVGLPIYHWIINNKQSDKNLTVLYNKVYSLIDQINIIR